MKADETPMKQDDAVDAAYEKFLNRLEPGLAGCDMKFIFLAGYQAALSAQHSDLEDEITALRAENERLRNELRFIASVIDDNIKETGEPHAITYKGERFTGPVADICVKLLRGIEKVARQALKGDKQS